MDGDEAHNSRVRGGVGRSGETKEVKLALQNIMSQVIKLGCAAGELQRLYEAAANNRPIFTDGKWGEATLEVALAMLQSSKEGRKISLSHQVPSF